MYQKTMITRGILVPLLGEEVVGVIALPPLPPPPPQTCQETPSRVEKAG